MPFALWRAVCTDSLPDLVGILEAEGRVKDGQTDGRGLIEVDTCSARVRPQMTRSARPYAGAAFPPVLGATSRCGFHTIKNEDV